MSAADLEAEFWGLYGEWGRDGDGEPLPCQVETYRGSNASGPVYAAAAPRPGLPQFPQQRLVRNPQGNEITSSTAVYAPRSIAVDFPLHSRVTLADGRRAAVLAVSWQVAEGLFDFARIDLE